MFSGTCVSVSLPKFHEKNANQRKISLKAGHAEL